MDDEEEYEIAMVQRWLQQFLSWRQQSLDVENGWISQTISQKWIIFKKDEKKEKKKHKFEKKSFQNKQRNPKKKF